MSPASCPTVWRPGCTISRAFSICARHTSTESRGGCGGGEHHRALTLLCGLCGLRFGEAVALRRRDLDLDRGLVHVTRTATKDGREKTVGAPKTAAGIRTVAMPQLVVDALRRLDLDTLTPLAALNILASLRARLEGME